MFCFASGLSWLSSALIWSVFACGVRSQDAQELTSFDEIRDFIDSETGVLSAVIHTRRCQSVDVDVTERHQHLIEDFDQWLYFDYGNGTEKYRTTKSEIMHDANGILIFTILEAFNDGNVWVMSQYLDAANLGFSTKTELVCPIGEGARFFAYGKGQPSNLLSEYEDLRTALLEGKDIYVKSEVSDCEGGDQLGFARLINGKNGIQFWEILNQGSESEVLQLWYDVWVDYPYYLASSPVGIEKILVTVRQDGSVKYLPIIVDLQTWEDGFEFPDTGFGCQLGTSFRPTSPEAQDGEVVVYEDFEQLAEGLLQDLRLEMVLDTDKCESLEGADANVLPVIGSLSPRFWMLDNSPEGRNIQFAANQIQKQGVDGLGLQAQAQVLIIEDNTVTVAQTVFDPLTGEIVARVQAVCQLGTGVVMRSARRLRNVLISMEDLNVALFEGRRLSWEADLSQCSSNEVPEGSSLVFGGTFLEGTYFDTELNNGTFIGTTAVLVGTDDDPVTSFDWLNIGLGRFGSPESAFVDIKLFDYAWQDGVKLQQMWLCPPDSYQDVYLYY